MANASLKATLTISSTDLLDSVNLSKTLSSVLTIDGDNRQGLTTIKTSTTFQNLSIENFSGAIKKAYLYIKNTDATDALILADDGAVVFARLEPGEFCFYPSADNTTVQVKASANTPGCEFFALEVL